MHQPSDPVLNPIAPKLHPNEPRARCTPRPTTELTEAMVHTLQRIPGAGLKGEGFPHQVLGQLLHSPNLMTSFLEWWVSSKLELALSVREQELVILRMACLYSSDYVWKHHVKVGREFGVSEAELQAIRERGYDIFPSSRERMFLVLTDEMVERRSVSAQTWEALNDVLQPRDIMDLISLIAQYVLFALTNNVFQVQLEESLRTQPSLAD